MLLVLSYGATEDYAESEVFLLKGSSTHGLYDSYALCRGGGEDEGSVGVYH